MYIYPDNLKAAPTLWLWRLQDMAVGGLLAVLGVALLVQFGSFLFTAIAALYLFLTIRFDDVCILDFQEVTFVDSSGIAVVINALGDLSDVNLSSPQEGQVLAYNYQTGKWVNSNMPSLTGYATKQWVQDQGYLTQHQSLVGYATEQWVSDEIVYRDGIEVDGSLYSYFGESGHVTLAPGEARLIEIKYTDIIRDRFSEQSSDHFYTGGAARAFVGFKVGSDRAMVANE